MIKTEIYFNAYSGLFAFRGNEDQKRRINANIGYPLFVHVMVLVISVTFGN